MQQRAQLLRYTQANGYGQNVIETYLGKKNLVIFIENYQCVSVLEAKPKLKQNWKLCAHIQSKSWLNQVPIETRQKQHQNIIISSWLTIVSFLLRFFLETKTETETESFDSSILPVFLIG